MIFRSLIKALFVSSLKATFKYYRNEEFLEIRGETNDVGVKDLAVFFDPIRIYNSDSVEKELQLKDGTPIIVSYDHIVRNWGIFNLDTDEKVYPLKMFDVNVESDNILSVSFRDKSEAATSWQKIKEWSV